MKSSPQDRSTGGVALGAPRGSSLDVQHLKTVFGRAAEVF